MEVEQQQGLIYYIQKVGRERKGREGERERREGERKEGREGGRERKEKRRKGGRGRKNLATLYSEKLAEGEDVEGVLRREKERGEVQHLQFLLESLNTMLTHIHISLYRSQKQQNLYVHWIGSLMIWLE